MGIVVPTPALYHHGNEITFFKHLAQGLAHKPYQQMTSGLKLDRPAIKKKKDIKELTGSPYHLSNNTPFRCPAAKRKVVNTFYNKLTLRHPSYSVYMQKQNREPKKSWCNYPELVWDKPARLACGILGAVRKCHSAHWLEVTPQQSRRHILSFSWGSKSAPSRRKT